MSPATMPQGRLQKQRAAAAAAGSAPPPALHAPAALHPGPESQIPMPVSSRNTNPIPSRKPVPSHASPRIPSLTPTPIPNISFPQAPGPRTGLPQPDSQNSWPPKREFYRAPAPSQGHRRVDSVNDNKVADQKPAVQSAKLKSKSGPVPIRSNHPAPVRNHTPVAPVRNNPPAPSRVQATQSSPAPAPAPAPAIRRQEKTKTGLFGRSKDKKMIVRPPGAWLVDPGREGRMAFDIDNMLAGRPVRELWNESSDCFVHLFPQSSSKGPSFRIDSSMFASSAMLKQRASSVANTEDYPSSRDLYLDLRFNGKAAPEPPKKSLESPLSDDAELMIEMRNVFGFLCGQTLVATEKRFTFFDIFMRIADHLQRFEFTNLDGSSFGEVASSSFDSYVTELRLADVRTSSKKAVEMLVLGERMRSVNLYNEAFTHVAGKLEDVKRVAPVVYQLVSSTTQTRLSRAAMDLDKRIENTSSICSEFIMPSLFSGIVNSKALEERRHVNFDTWKSSFSSMRKFFLSYYRNLYGSWPPRPNPKKNTLQSNGLNRVVLLQLYNDLGSMYDLLVDRNNLTNRTSDGVAFEDRKTDQPRVYALRQVLSEWDRASPPVKPPMPFDVPIIPSLHGSRPGFGQNAQNDIKMMGKKVKADEVMKVLVASSNSGVSTSPFLIAFRDFERSQAKGCTIQEIADLRYGQWLFMYAVLQMLPILVVNAPGIRYTEGAEYFLCEASRGGVPWARDGTAGGRSNQWYGVAGGSGMVSLPSDVIENSIEGVFRRSHCWIMAERWSAANPIMAAAVHEQQRATSTSAKPAAAAAVAAAASLPPPPEILADDIAPGFRHRTSIDSASRYSVAAAEMDLTPPHPVFADDSSLRVDSRSSSPARSKRHSIIDLGLEALPHSTQGNGVPSKKTASPASSRPVSSYAGDPAITFDAILAGVDGQQGGKKK